MGVMYKSYKNLYKDSVSLMQISAALLNYEGVLNATVAMQTEANLQRAQASGLNLDLKESPNDLLIACELADDSNFDEIIAFVDDKLFAKVTTDNTKKSRHIGSIAQAKEELDDANLALISVAGRYATAEALKALGQNLNVMIFSDNVSEDDELMLKQEAKKRDLLLMGPDCGTAIINGKPLAFANRVNLGSIGVIGASGTGTQEVTCAISNLGAGISQAIGTGGRDLHEKIGAITTLYAIDLLEQDEKTKTIVVISKPPAKSIATKVIERLKQVKKDVVVHFVGNNDFYQENNIYFTRSLLETAKVACDLNQGRKISVQDKEQINVSTDRLLKAIYCGGTFCAEAQNLALKANLKIVSNVPIDNACKYDGNDHDMHAFFDMGDDEFTNGRPHPMIDPFERNAMIKKQMENEKTAVILFDVVLGYGASLNPIDDLVEIIKSNTRSDLNFVCNVCGTDLDIQNREDIINRLSQVNVKVATSNEQAVMTALSLL